MSPFDIHDRRGDYSCHCKALQTKHTKMADCLRPLRQPIAIYPQYIASTHATTLLMKSSSHWKNSYAISLIGAPIPTVSSHEPRGIMEPPSLLSIDAQSWSLSHRMHVYDDRTYTKLCTIRRENWSFRSRYYAETSEGSARLFESESRNSWGRKNVFTFQNQAGKGEIVELKVKSPAFSQRQEVYLEHRMVGLIETDRWHVKTHYNLTAAQGLDIFVLVCIAALVDDQRRSEND